MPNAVESQWTVHDEMLVMMHRLVAEHHGVVPAGTVMRTVARCRERLIRTGVRNGIVPATEAAARVRLARRSRG